MRVDSFYAPGIRHIAVDRGLFHQEAHRAVTGVFNVKVHRIIAELIVPGADHRHLQRIIVQNHPVIFAGRSLNANPAVFAVGVNVNHIRLVSPCNAIRYILDLKGQLQIAEILHRIVAGVSEIQHFIGFLARRDIRKHNAVQI